jgi:hypothetical protein
MGLLYLENLTKRRSPSASYARQLSIIFAGSLREPRCGHPWHTLTWQFQHGDNCTRTYEYI